SQPQTESFDHLSHLRSPFSRLCERGEQQLERREQMYCGQPVEVWGEPRNYSGNTQAVLRECEGPAPGSAGRCRSGISEVLDAAPLELLQESFRLAQIGRVEPLGEPLVALRQRRASLHRLALARPQPGQARRRTEFQRLCLLRARNGDRLEKA